RKNITIDNTKVSGSLPLIDFPVLINLKDSDLRTKVQPDGDDIFFTNTSGLQLDHEIELFKQAYNSTHAHLVTWVRIPSLSATTDTVIIMYYGNSTIGSQENPSGVWNANYMGVWHLSETTGNALDSTSYGINGTLTGGVSHGGAGQLGYGYSFDGIDGFVDFGDPVDGHLDFGLESFSFSFWLNNSYNGVYQRPVYKGASSDPTPGYTMYRRAPAQGNDTVVAIGDGTAREKRGSSVPLPWDVMVYVVGVVDRGNNLIYFYKDGVAQGSAVDISLIGSVSTDRSLQLSRDANPVKGIIDEFRVVNVSLSADWIVTEHNNQFDPSSFHSISNEEVLSYWPYPDFSYRKTVTINNNKVSGNSHLENFPLLIDTYDIDLRTFVQPDGDDILFADVTGTKLDHEIEIFNQTYNNTHAYLVAWIRIPNLSATADTFLTMYYGNSTIGNQANPEGVWDANYLGVWHLSEMGTGTRYDSTSNNRDTTTNNYESDEGMNGIIEGADDFDGSDDYVNWTNAIVQFNGTYSAWIYPHATVGEFNFLADNAYQRRIYINDGNIQVETDTDAVSFKFTSSSIITNQWYYVTFVRTGDVGDLYINGSFIQQVVTPGADQLTISGIGGDATLVRMFDGVIDEVRISNINRSSDWILTEFNNQKDTANFYKISNTDYGPNYQGPPGIVEWVTGEAINSNTVVTNSSIT
ncbi:MAG: DUF2341 domain-containing protein, partial [Candidatus Kariarchaeaceae archaeon]